MGDVQQQAQRITDGLYLGPHQVAQNGAALEKLGITSVVSVLGEDQDFGDVVIIKPRVLG